MRKHQARGADVIVVVVVAVGMRRFPAKSRTLVGADDRWFGTILLHAGAGEGGLATVAPWGGGFGAGGVVVVGGVDAEEGGGGEVED